MRVRATLILIAGVAACAGVLFGYDTGVISGAILYINHQFHLSPQMNGFVVSSVLLGAVMGAILSGALSDRYGRKRLLVTDAIVFIIGTLISAFAPTVTVLVLGRIVVGIAIGIASYSAPLYISEISPAHLRGALVSMNQLAIAFGICVSYVVDYFCALHGGAHAWRLMLGLGVVPAVGLLLGTSILPRSPRWVIASGDAEKGRAILYRLRRMEHVVETEFKQIVDTLQHETGRFRAILSKQMRPCLCIAVGLAIFQQITGINTILYYAPTIFQIAGFKQASNAILASIWIGVFFFLFTALALPMIDRWGRKPLLYLGIGVMMGSMFLLSHVFAHPIQPGTHAMVLAIASLVAYIVGFAISLGPIAWLLIAEVFPLRMRGIGSSVATGANWGANWLVAITFLTLIQLLGPSKTFAMYGTVCLFNLFFVYAYVPETKGCSLETIEMNLYSGKSARELGSLS